MGAEASCCKKEEILEVTNVVHQKGDEDVPDSPDPRDPFAVLGPQGTSQPSLHSQISVLTEVPSLRADQDLMRGISLHKSLRKFGRVWRTKPSRLTEGDHQVLSKVCVKDPPSPGVKILLDVVRLLAKEQGIFGPILPKLKDVRQSISLSAPCSFGSNALIQYGWRRPFLWPEVDHFDVFISHTWETNGRWKILAMMLQQGWPYMIILWLVYSALAGSLFLYTDLLPYNSVFPIQSFNWSGWGVLGCWMRVSGLLGMVTGLFMAPYWPRCRSTLAFVDVVSIDQIDPEMTRRGVYGLGGFLSHSSELRVLWSPQLFSRLWCIFELAAFRKANPKGKIVLAPLYVEMIVGFLLLWLAFMQLLYFLLLQVLQFSSFISFVGMVPVIPCIHQTRKICREKRRLLNELKQFNLNEAGCSVDFDRNFILAGIEEWYGTQEAFTEYVRGPLFRELVAPLETLRVPVQYWVLLGLHEMSSLLEFTVGYMSGGAPVDVVLAQFLSWPISNVLWRIISFRLGLFLCDRCSSRMPGACGLLDFMKTFLIWVVTVVFLLSTFEVTAVVERSSLVVASAGACVTIAVALFSLWAATG
ncbi:unnamed protein product [Durusdinium trenchii]|uniref:Uncharacterized protein n=1 Tax=Durusdinium trenchii TaxID=1381693 RepID=A0ABP0LBM6_9DINO